MAKSNIILILIAVTFISMEMSAQHNHDLVIKGDIEIQNNAELYIWGDLHIESAAGTVVNEGKIELEGNLYKDNLSTYTSLSTGEVVFRNDNVNTTDAQFIQGEFTGANALNILEVDTRAASPLFYLNNGDTEITQELRLTNGIVTSQTPDGLHPSTITDNRLIVSNPTPNSITGNYNNSWLVGPWNRAVSPSTSYLFPMGSDSPQSYGLQSVEMTFGAGPATELELNFLESELTSIGTEVICDVGTPPNNLGTPDGVEDTLSIDCVAGMWDIQSFQDFPTFEITLNPSAALLNKCAAELNYMALEGAVLDPCPTDAFSRTGVTALGRFDIPSVVNPENFFLSIELSYFLAKPMEDFILLEWETLSEIDNAGFEVQRSKDGVIYEQLGWVDGAINSDSPITYNWKDINVEKNVTYYYRLKVVSLNGAREDSEVRSTVLEEIIEYYEAIVYPNPLDPDQDQLHYEALRDGKITLEIVDETGITVLEEIIEVRQGLNTVNVGNINDGLYYLILQDDQYVRKSLLMIQR